MRILKRGGIPKPVYQGRCSRCKTLFECDDNEVRYEQDGQRGAHMATCPVCKSTVYVSIKEPLEDGVYD